MDGGGGLVVALGLTFLALVVLVGYLGFLSAKRRREAFAALAAARGWTYAAEDDAWVGAFAGHPFESGHARRATNVLRGDAAAGRRFVAFDYSYRTTETRTDAEGRTTTHEETHAFFVVAVDTGVDFPPLEVTPESFFGRAFARFTGDIDLESEEFNRAFTVRCPQRKFAFDVLHPRMMEFLLAHRRASFRFDRRYLLSVSPGSPAPADVDPALSLLESVLDLVPGFVWQDARGA